MKIKINILVSVFLLFLISCGAGINTTKGMLNRLKKAGHKVKMLETFSSPFNTEEAFWFLIDGEKIAAYKFKSIDDTKKYGPQLKHGFIIGIWGFEFARPKVQDKIRAALK